MNELKLSTEIDRLSSEDANIVNAAKAKSVTEYSATDLAKELNCLFGFIIKDIGLKQPSEHEYKYFILRITNILSQYYSKLTITEIKLAFEMLIIGRLGQIEHYQQLSVDYVCKVLNAYKILQQKAFANAVKLQSKPAPKSLPVVVPDPKSVCRKIYEHYKETGELKFGIHEDVVIGKFLQEKKAIPEIEITDEDKAQTISRVLREVAEGKRPEIQGVWAKKNKLSDRELEPPTYTNALYRVIKNYFDKLIKKGI